MGMGRWAVIVAGGALGALILGVALVGLMFRGFQIPLAWACPGCGGFDRVTPSILIESGSNLGDRSQILADIAIARRRVTRVYRSMRSRPTLIVCRTEGCYRRMVGGNLADSRGLAYFAEILVLSPRRLGGTIAAHELSHIELHRRIGLLRNLGGAVPAWFDEGLAVLVADDRRYVAPPGPTGRCLTRPQGSLPSSKLLWSVGAKADHSIYAVAACRVAEQLGPDINGAALADEIARGTSATSLGPKDQPQAASLTTPASM